MRCGCQVSFTDPFVNTIGDLAFDPQVLKLRGRNAASLDSAVHDSVPSIHHHQQHRVGPDCDDGGSDDDDDDDGDAAALLRVLRIPLLQRLALSSSARLHVNIPSYIPRPRFHRCFHSHSVRRLPAAVSAPSRLFRCGHRPIRACDAQY
eukprot:25653-Rhodomonas_salina.3